MTITAIKAQVKHTERLSIFVDGKYTFSLTYNQLLEQRLHVGQELTDLRVAELTRISDFGKAYERALIFAMVRPRSVKEMYDYARRKQWSSGDTTLIIEKLIARKYVDDRNFARAWVENRALTKKTSQRKLRLELKQKGIADNIVADTLESTKYNEQSALEELIAKKRKLARYRQDEQKLIQYLARQGFDFDDIKMALNH